MVTLPPHATRQAYAIEADRSRRGAGSLPLAQTLLATHELAACLGLANTVEWRQDAIVGIPIGNMNIEGVNATL
ncbi:MAG: hypothetical protein C4345_08930, partial [Chloroflexota bacterium]